MAAYNWPRGRAECAYLVVRRVVVELHASTFILGEVDRVLREELGWEEDRAERTVAQIRRVAGEIHEPAESVVTAIEDDPTENRIFECALAADTKLLVTGDKKHLLPLGFFRGISTVGLSVFLASFSAG